MRLIIALVLLGFAFGCVGESGCEKGYIKAGSECCLDENDNKVCDDQELEKLVLVVKPQPPSCDDGIQNQGEAGVDCGGPCEICPTTTTIESPPDEKRETDTTPRDRITWPAENGTSREIIPPDELMAGTGSGNVNNTAVGTESFGEDLIGTSAGESGNASTDLNAQTTDEEMLHEALNTSFCAESKQYLTSTRQDGYLGDESTPLDGIGDNAVTSAYNMVGDVADSAKGSNRTSDWRYKTVIAIPLGNITGAISDARLNILLSGKVGSVLDTQVEHINCTGTVGTADYGSPSDGFVGKIMNAEDKTDMYYSVDVSEFVQRDIDSKLKYSCYRLFWNDSQLESINDKKTQRIILQGAGSEYAPYLSFIRRPCVRCKMNADCGKTEYITDYQCNGFSVLRQYLHYRCAQPETEGARCVITQDSDVVDRCGSDELCTAGENRCYLETCYDGLMNNGEDGRDCGGRCRPCHCFNRRKDTKESTGDYGMVEEEGIDCGGDCKPCPLDLRILKIQIISPNPRDLYDSRQVNFRYYANKNTLSCWYALNGGANRTLKGSEKEITAAEGVNNMTLYCNDSLGQHDSFSLGFNVESGYVACRTDNTKVNYTRGFDKAVFFSDNSSQGNVTGACDKDFFLKATTLDDSTKHQSGPMDASKILSDKLFNEAGSPALSFSCEDRTGYSASYIHLSKTLNPANITRLGVIPYFSEIGEVLRKDTFWRFYFYARNKNSVKNDTYLDIPYLPQYSSCANETVMKYQELDLTALVGNMTFTGEGSLELRMALYSRHSGIELDLRELRFFAY